MRNSVKQMIFFNGKEKKERKKEGGESEERGMQVSGELNLRRRPQPFCGPLPGPSYPIRR